MSFLHIDQAGLNKLVRSIDEIEITTTAATTKKNWTSWLSSEIMQGQFKLQFALKFIIPVVIVFCTIGSFSGFKLPKNTSLSFWNEDIWLPIRSIWIANKDTYPISAYRDLSINKHLRWQTPQTPPPPPPIIPKPPYTQYLFWINNRLEIVFCDQILRLVPILYSVNIT